MNLISLPRTFYLKDTEKVARELLGRLLIKKSGNKTIVSRIVETEAYYGEKDPASRAFTTPKMAEPMWNEGGNTFVYMVHNNWLVNIVTAPRGIPAAVLIRAIEPMNNLPLLEKNRNKTGFLLTNGPGKLCQALGITKRHNLLDVCSKNSEIFIAEPEDNEPFGIVSSHRIGIKRDLKRKLRFYIKDNRWVSKR